MAIGCLQSDSNFCQVGIHDNQRVSVLLYMAFVLCKICHLYFLPPTPSLLQSGLHLFFATQTCPQIALECFQHGLLYQVLNLTVMDTFTAFMMQSQGSTWHGHTALDNLNISH